DGDHGGILEIPDREWLRWVKTWPLGYGGLLSDLNEQQGGKAVPLITLVKHWRDVHFARCRPKSYWLEALVYEYLYQGWVTTKGKGWAVLVSDLVDAVYDRFSKVLEEDEEQCP